MPVKGKSLIDAITFGNLSSVVKLDPGSYSFLARNSANGSVIGTTKEVKVEAGKRYVVTIMSDNNALLMSVVVIEIK